MFTRFVNFMRGIATNWLGRIGVALAASSWLIFIILEILRAIGLLTNALIGLVTYMTLPALFILGLLLILLGWHRLKRRTGKTTRELMAERFDPAEIEARFAGAGVFGMIVLLMLISLVFLGGATVRMLHFMDQAHFCGTACHKVMNPEWTVYQQSPHANVSCVECHVGEGVGALVDSKINGLWQIISASFNLYERPIPTPVRQLRPARETCEKCHWPDKFYGDRLKMITRYAMDEANTAYYSTLSLKIGSGEGERGEIHWHVAAGNELRYASVDDEREEMIWVDVRQPDGSFKRYANRDLPEKAAAGEQLRTLDCVDCHNRATHIYENPDKGLDERLTRGELDRSLPFLKREALAAITSNYPGRPAAVRGIADRLHGFYREAYPRLTVAKMLEIDQAVETLQAMYRRNIHHGMNIAWNSYPDFRGHEAGRGCFRCHNEKLVDEDGRAISYDCTLCHSILAQESREPFRFLMPLQKEDPDYRQHQYLRDEFLRTGH